MTKLAKAFHTAVNIIAIMAVLTALLAIWAVITAEKGKAPQLFGFSMLIVVTGSMEPEIPVGDLVFTDSVDMESLKVGDIIAFYADDPQIKDMINTHRIAGITQENGEIALITKGDANTYADTYPVLEAKLVGKVIGTSGILGALAGALANKYVFIVVIMLPLVIIILSNLRQIISLIKKGMDEIDEEDENCGESGKQ